MPIQANTTPLIVALDYDNQNEALALIDKLDPLLCQIKIGKSMFTRLGPDFVKTCIDRQFKIFLDLKYHDIPNQVAGACRAAADLGVWMTDVHASGGPKMLAAAREALEPYGKDRPLLIAITVLTSLSQEELTAIGFQGTPEQVVTHLATLTAEQGLDGVVCSSLEAEMLRQSQGDDFLLVTPGIRLPEDASHDQTRIMTPQAAMVSGADYLVMGRSITTATDPSRVVNHVLATIT